MSHKAQQDFVNSMAKVFPEFFEWVSVLEIGSLDINGSIRDYFKNSSYLGIDLGPGPGVDEIARGENLLYESRSFDVTISVECFEHNPEWEKTFLNMVRMSRGMVIFTCASDGRPEHGTERTTPNDSPYTAQSQYYRNLSEKDFKDLPLSNYFLAYAFSSNTDAHDLYFWGIVKDYHFGQRNKLSIQGSPKILDLISRCLLSECE